MPDLGRSGISYYKADAFVIRHLSFPIPNSQFLILNLTLPSVYKKILILSDESVNYT